MVNQDKEGTSFQNFNVECHDTYFRSPESSRNETLSALYNHNLELYIQFECVEPTGNGNSTTKSIRLVFFAIKNKQCVPK